MGDERGIIFFCPNGHAAGVRNHQIDADGTAKPSFLCPREGCGFHDWVRLLNYDLPAQAGRTQTTSLIQNMSVKNILETIRRDLGYEPSTSEVMARVVRLEKVLEAKLNATLESELEKVLASAPAPAAIPQPAKPMLLSEAPQVQPQQPQQQQTPPQPS